MKDRRALQIVVTDEGRALWQQLKVRGDRIIDLALGDLSEAERDQLFSLLARVRDALSPP